MPALPAKERVVPQAPGPGYAPSLQDVVYANLNIDLAKIQEAYDTAEAAAKGQPGYGSEQDKKAATLRLSKFRQDKVDLYVQAKDFLASIQAQAPEVEPAPARAFESAPAPASVPASAAAPSAPSAPASPAAAAAAAPASAESEREEKEEPPAAVAAPTKQQIDKEKKKQAALTAKKQADEIRKQMIEVKAQRAATLSGAKAKAPDTAEGAPQAKKARN
jgi:colicin import membrane protein